MPSEGDTSSWSAVSARVDSHGGRDNGQAQGVLFIAAAPEERATRHGTFFSICLAGAAGTGARYLIAVWTAQRLGSAFPYGTLIVNLTGCFVIAALMHAAPLTRSIVTSAPPQRAV